MDIRMTNVTCPRCNQVSEFLASYGSRQVQYGVRGGSVVELSSKIIVVCVCSRCGHQWEHGTHEVVSDDE
jgi:hypothetical protein